MKEFIEKLIERLEEYRYSHLAERDSKWLKHCKEKEKYCQNNDCFFCVWDKAIEIVNQLAEEYKHGHFGCNTNGDHEKCEGCPVYDCKDRNKIWFGVKEQCKEECCEWDSDYKIISDKYKRETGCGYTFYDLHHAEPFKFCPYCGKKIKVVEPKGE